MKLSTLTLKKLATGGLLLAMALAALSGNAILSSDGTSGIPQAYAACDGQGPPPDLDCPPTPTPTPINR